MKVAIVGSGAMGAGIAQVAAQAGEEVMLFDSRPGAAEKAVSGVRARFEQMAAKGKLSSEQASAAGQRLLAVASLADLAPAQLVIEAIVEDLEAKRTLLRQLDAVVSSDCLLATNTSSLSLAAMATALRSPERLAGMHFFNPAPLMELVEVVGSIVTSVTVLDRIEALARSWRKTPVRVRATPGFIVNRVARPFYAEGLRLVAEQATDPATLDALMREAGGFRMGPCELTDLIGQDVNFAVTRSVFAAYFGDPRFQPSLVQQELVEAGWLGRKSGRGFYIYGEGALAPAISLETPRPAPARIAMAAGGDALAEALAQRIEAAGVEVVRTPHLPTDILLRVTDGRTAAELETGGAQPQPTVVVDLALDYARVKHLAASVSPRSIRPGHTAGWDAIVGALQAAGIAVTRLRDLPGLAVMRTVAMLANEAADAMHFGVADARAVDLAMCKGVNYPLGPLAWADRIGIQRISSVLSALGSFYGEDRYRISPALRHRQWTGDGFYE
ncbi:MAG TPA: 3-hydroxyacyl-CoA dehydrogenase [Terriglobales bacterium]